MEKSRVPSVHEIDDRIVSQFRVLNSSDNNIMNDNIALIMEDPPLLKSHLHDQPHQISMHCIMFVKRGYAHLSLNFVDYPLQRGDLIVVPPNNIMQFNHFSPDFTPLILCFDLNPFAESGLAEIDAFKVNADNHNFKIFENHFSIMQLSLLQPTSDNKDFAHQVLSLLRRARHLYEIFPTTIRPHTGNPGQSLSSKFIRLIIQQTQPNRPISFYANHLNVSPNYLSITVKKHTGRTPNQWIAKRVLALVCQLLVSSENLTLEAIAEQVGYSTPSQLIRFFKREMNGQTPAKFRRINGL